MFGSWADVEMIGLQKGKSFCYLLPCDNVY